MMVDGYDEWDRTGWDGWVAALKKSETPFLLLCPRLLPAFYPEDPFMATNPLVSWSFYWYQRLICLLWRGGSSIVLNLA